MRRAGYNPAHAAIPLVVGDIGLLINSPHHAREVLRVREVPGSTHRVQPYIVLDIPGSKQALPHKDIQFELVDSAGNVCDTQSKQAQLVYGRNYFLAPKAWSVEALADLDASGHWTVRVCLGSEVIASHRFRMLVVENEIILGTDGEIKEHFLEALEVYQSGESLEELLREDTSPSRRWRN